MKNHSESNGGGGFYGNLSWSMPITRRCTEDFILVSLPCEILVVFWALKISIKDKNNNRCLKATNFMSKHKVWYKCIDPSGQ